MKTNYDKVLLLSSKFKVKEMCQGIHSGQTVCVVVMELTLVFYFLCTVPVENNNKCSNVVIEQISCYVRLADWLSCKNFFAKQQLTSTTAVCDMTLPELSPDCCNHSGSCDPGGQEQIPGIMTDETYNMAQ